MSSEPQQIGSLFIGLMILTCALLSESARIADGPTSAALVVVDAMIFAVGALLVIRAAVRLISRHYYAGVVLAAAGTPLAVLMLAALLFSLFNGSTLSWLAFEIGACGVALMVMALRSFMRLPRHLAKA